MLYPVSGLSVPHEEPSVLRDKARAWHMPPEKTPPPAHTADKRKYETARQTDTGPPQRPRWRRPVQRYPMPASAASYACRKSLAGNRPAAYIPHSWGTASPRVHLPAETTAPMIHPNIISPDRKSTRLNSSHQIISYTVFCLKQTK